jgi:large subunit ribosomal protein L24e
MPVCSFCRVQYEFPRGTTMVQKDGTIKFYCGSKCKKNSEMGRNNKKVTWVKKSDQIKEMRNKKKKA